VELPPPLRPGYESALDLRFMFLEPSNRRLIVKVLLLSDRCAVNLFVYSLVESQTCASSGG
jgi:hypothetical protein